MCLEGGLVQVQVQAVDGLDLEGDVPGEAPAAVCATVMARPTSDGLPHRLADYQAVAAAERGSVRNPHWIRE